MITILHPKILGILEEFHCGLLPLRDPDTQKIFLTVKAPKETILTAKLKQEFYLYLVPAEVKEFTIHGIITAFFDDFDEPLVITSPLFSDDDFTHMLIELMSEESFDVYFFDEHNREMLGYKVRNPESLNFREQSSEFKFAQFSYENAREHLNEMSQWFGLRCADDDDAAIKVQFLETIFPEDLFIMNLDPDLYHSQGQGALMPTILERIEPGPLQEFDILMLLKRVFPISQIYLNPFRIDENTEFLDVLVVTEENALFIQAKDSPNTAAILARSMKRKISTVVSQLEKAIKQMRGAIRHADSGSHLKLMINGEPCELSLEGKTTQCLIVIKELFDRERSCYSKMVLDLVGETKTPCVVMDYPQLHNLSLFRGTEEGFFHAYHSVFEYGFRNGEFPKLRFGLVPDGDTEYTVTNC